MKCRTKPLGPAELARSLGQFYYSKNPRPSLYQHNGEKITRKLSATGSARNFYFPGLHFMNHWDVHSLWLCRGNFEQTWFLFCLRVELVLASASAAAERLTAAALIIGGERLLSMLPRKQCKKCTKVKALSEEWVRKNTLLTCQCGPKLWQMA